MNTPKYLLAKYIPDLRRGEPRNVGVIAWSAGDVEARFVGEKHGFPGEVDGRSIPSFVTSSQAYKQWIEYWRLQMGRETIIPASGGAAVSRDDANFLTALRAANKGNFVLVDGGFLLDPVSAEDLAAVADHLFATLVDTTSHDEPRDPTLDDVAERLLRQTGVATDRNFHSRYRVQCQIAAGHEETFEFDYAYKNGTLQRLYERLSLPKRRATQQVRVDATAWKFDKVNRANLLPEKPVAIVYPTDEQRSDPETRRMLDVLRTVGRVLDLHDERAAEAEFRSLAQLTDH